MKPYFRAGHEPARTCKHKHRTPYAALRCYTTRTRRLPASVVVPVWRFTATNSVVCDTTITREAP